MAGISCWHYYWHSKILIYKLFLMIVEKNAHLQDVLETHRMNHIEGLLSKYKSKRDEVKEALEENYHSKIYSPINSGSYAKHTAINSKFDLDIVVPFKRDSFENLEKMFGDVCCFLQEEYGSVAKVRKQKVSIGMQFYADSDRDIIDLDIVPGRELNQDQYKDDKNLNLHIDSNYGLLNKNTWVQTNIQEQIEHIKAKDNERKIIRLLKIWKNCNCEKYKSFLLELITIKAFEEIDISGNLWEKLKAVMEYIKDNVTKEGFKLTDPGNSNNNVIDTLTLVERVNFSDRMNILLCNICQNKENIKQYFPLNKDFEDELSSNTSYGIKGATVASSIPKNNQRFG